MKPFVDRVDAGRQLASALLNMKGKNAIVLAIPRGGVVVGFEVADALGVPLDVIIPRKIGAPNNPELAIGAVTEDGTTILNEELIKDLQVEEDYIRKESERQQLEIERRMKSYRRETPYSDVGNRDVIIVDDGIATGATMKAALASVRRRGAKSVTVAVPVGPSSTIQELKKEADRVVCLSTPEFFQAIGQFYDDFGQTFDEEVVRLLKLNARKQATSSKTEGASA